MRSIIITGASSGMGASLAKLYAKPGVTLALIGRNAARLKATADAATAAGASVEQGIIDVRDAEALKRFVADFNRRHPVDLVVANAGIFDGRQEDETVESLETSLHVIETNITGTINTVHAVLPALRARGEGQVAIIASLAGLTPLAGALGYSASKSALVAYGLGLNQALHKEGVAVSVICPGFVETAITERHVGWQPFRLTAEQAAEKIARGIVAKKALVAFPLPLHLIARPSILVPEVVRRFVGNYFTCRSASPAVEPQAPARPLRMAGE